MATLSKIIEGSYIFPRFMYFFSKNLKKIYQNDESDGRKAKSRFPRKLIKQKMRGFGGRSKEAIKICPGAKCSIDTLISAATKSDLIFPRGSESSWETPNVHRPGKIRPNKLPTRISRLTVKYQVIRTSRLSLLNT